MSKYDVDNTMNMSETDPEPKGKEISNRSFWFAWGSLVVLVVGAAVITTLVLTLTDDQPTVDVQPIVSEGRFNISLSLSHGSRLNRLLQQQKTIGLSALISFKIVN